MNPSWIIRFTDGSEVPYRAETIQDAMRECEFAFDKPVRSARFDPNEQEFGGLVESSDGSNGT